MDSNVEFLLFFVFTIKLKYKLELLNFVNLGTEVAQWLRSCATNRKVAGSIPDCVMEFFIDIILPIAL